MNYFITPALIKQITPITNNVDVTDYNFNIKNVADMYIRSILGTHFYNYLLGKYNTQTMTPDELLLLDEIQPAIAWKCTSESVITLSYQLKNKGIQTQSGDFSNSADYKDLMFLVRHYSDKSDFYQNRLVEFLKINKNLFSEFYSSSNKDSIALNSCNHPTTFNTNILFI